ncbi:hypothetical protein GGI42DRAFT_366187 [Trichoderma sp. SZMC 28013]
MSYYDTIRYPSIFSQRARNYTNFISLTQSPGFQSGASNWDARHLFANRVICTAPEWRLLLLDDFFPENLAGVHPCIQDLITGPLGLQLSELWEPQIVQLCQPDSLAYSTHIGNEGNPSMLERPRRERTQTTHGDFVPSDSFVIGSSSPNRPPTSSGDSERSIGYRGNLSAPLLGDAAVRLASCFIRCVINYAQPPDKQGPYIHFRDERLTHRFNTMHHDIVVEAVDDGGLQVVGENGAFIQVAMLEGKRTFQMIMNGEPKVPDELLAQLVGEALALRQSKSSTPISSDIISILATADCVKFFHFEMSEEYLDAYQTAAIDSDEHFLLVNSTQWMSIKTPDHRELIIYHLLAILSWADSLV